MTSVTSTAQFWMEKQPSGANSRDEEFVFVDASEKDTKEKSAEKSKEVRVIREEIYLEEDDDDEEESEAAEIEGDTDDLLAGLPDDTEVYIRTFNPFSMLSRCIVSGNRSCSRAFERCFQSSITSLCLQPQTTLFKAEFPEEYRCRIFAPLVHLEDLDFYDNQIKHVGHALEKLPLRYVCAFLSLAIALYFNNRVIDFSFNLLRSIPDVFTVLTRVETVYFVQNKITNIGNLQNLSSLRSLELGGNRIRVSASDLQHNR